MDPHLAKYMYYGLTAAWLVLVLYMFTLIARQRKVQDEITRLKRMIESGAK